MNVLAIDTTLSAVSACVLDGNSLEAMACETLALERGHAEALIPLLDRVVASAEGGLAGVGKIAVTVGPGSFTGIRIGLSAARAIGLAIGAPIVGVSTLAAYAAPIVLDSVDGVIAAAIDAKHNRVYVTAFSGGRPILSPRLSSPRDAVRGMGAGPFYLVGTGAGMIAAEAKAMGLSAQIISDAGAPDIVYVARLGYAADPATAPARPLYLKAPDVKIAQNAVLSGQSAP